MPACERCLARAWLLVRLAAHLERERSRIEALLALPDDDLIAAVGGGHTDMVRNELEHFDADAARGRAGSAGLQLICRCATEYPSALRQLESPPAVLHVRSPGGLATALAEDPVAVVGARRASRYALDVAHALGRELAAAGLAVVSGMALGIDSAVHVGALSIQGSTIAVLPGGAERPYPAAKRTLHRRIVAGGAAVSELPPGTDVWRWMFPARNRIIAGLAAMTIVVEAGPGSGALVTARIARALGRPVGAVPGRITTPLAHGSNELLAHGAAVVRGAQDVLDVLFGAGTRTAASDHRPALSPDLRRLLDAIAGADDTAAALLRAGFSSDTGLAALASLELSGHIRREPGGRYSVLP